MRHPCKTWPWGPLLLLTCLAGLAWPSVSGAVGQPVAPSAAELKALESIRGLPPGEIVFSSRRDGKWRLFRILPDGAELARLSQGTANHTRPFFVLGGSKLIYQSDQDGPVQVWMAEPDLSKPQRLSPAGRQEYFHGLTSDGQRLLVAQARSPQGYVLRDMGSGQETPIDFSASGMRSGNLDVMLSPDGRKLAFQFKPDQDGQPERGVYVMDLEPGGRAINLRRIAEGCFTAWRADSQQMLTCRFTAFRGMPGTEIWLADLNGPREQLTRNLDWNYFPAWSPDESWMAWAVSPLYSHDHQTGQYEIYVKRLRDKNPIRLTFHTATSVDPTWRAGRSKLKGQGADFVYEAEDFAHGVAPVVEMAGASGGRAVLARREAGEPATVVYGQYDVLAPGSYVVRFRLQAGPLAGSGPLAELDVCVDSGKRILAKRQINSQDLTPGRLQEMELTFTSEQLLTGLECRVRHFPGVADLMVDVITIKPAQPTSWYQPIKELWNNLWRG